ncbi:MAG: cadmium-translocating P-type ATPase [Oligoflexia bacterium]|nr:cadmium-translocating P-type ATPase [Oligoflexia bacterium]
MSVGVSALPPVLQVACAHCGSRVARERVRAARDSFCCEGCEAVSGILRSRGLTGYYSLRERGGSLRRPAPAPQLDRSYAYLDDPAFRKLYASDAGEGALQMAFFAEGVHCAACVWLLEKLPEFVPGVRSVSLDLGSSTAVVRVPPSGSFAEAAREFHRLGYRPHPVRGTEQEELQARENRRMLIRVGLSGACTGNIMLLAFAVYGGADGSWARLFNWLSFVIFLPVLFHGAVPFYQEAWRALRRRQISIDVPIVLGIAVGAAASFANLLSGSGHVYFDSLSALVFLLLSSRYVMRRAQQGALHSTKLLHFLAPSVVRRKRVQAPPYEEISMDLLQPGDLIEVRPSEPVPIDGIVTSGRSHLNRALLTGESDPVAVGAGETVFAGTVNLDSVLEIRVQASGYATRLGAILRAIETGQGRKAPIVNLTDRISRYFVAVAVALAGAVFAWGAWSSGWQEGLNRALAMVIVTCPCALALATPLAMSVAIGRASRQGMLIKGADALERLASADSVYLDKTGTLTSGEFGVLEWSAAAGREREAERAALALEARSNHPVARAIVRHLSAKGAPEAGAIAEVHDFQERLGRGVSGRIGGVAYELRQAEPGASGTEVVLSAGGETIARIALGDQLREGAREAVERLRASGLEPAILSGDAEGPVARVAAALGIPADKTHARATPERKSELIRGEARALMVGDGANDAAALSSAYVGVAVHGGMEVSLRAADAYLARPGVGPVLELVTAARESMKVVRRNLAFSLVYNVIGGGAALLGWVDPLFAAVLMPLSALTVFVSSIAGTRTMRRALR